MPRIFDNIEQALLPALRQTLEVADRDGYELWLRDKIGSALGQDSGVWYGVSLHQVAEQDVCRISVRSAGRLVYLNSELYVRIGNGKKKLATQQALEYVRRQWGK